MNRTTTPTERAALRTTVTQAPLLILPDGPAPVRGLVLDVREIGILDDPRLPYLRLGDGMLYRLPELFLPWAESFIRSVLHSLTTDDGRPLLPARIEFAVQDGNAVAALREHGSTPGSTS